MMQLEQPEMVDANEWKAQRIEGGTHAFIARYIALHELQSRSVRSELDRLRFLIDDASGRLLQSFGVIKVFAERQGAPDVEQAVNHAISALQFHDMATQLAGHAAQRMGLIEQMTASLGRLPDASVDELTDVLTASACARRAGPVEQTCMEGGSVELF